MGTVIFVHEDTAKRPPGNMLEAAIVETGAARVSGDAEIRAYVVSPDEDEDPFR